MVPEDGDPAPPNAGISAAFAATIAPSSDAPTPPNKLPAGTRGSSKPPGHDSGLDATVAAPPSKPPSALDSGNDPTMAAPVTGELPPLPEVAASLYAID